MAAHDNRGNEAYRGYENRLGITLDTDFDFQAIEASAALSRLNEVCQHSSLEMFPDTGTYSGMEHENLSALILELSPANPLGALVGFWKLPASSHQVCLLRFRTLIFEISSEDNQPYQ